MLPQTGKSKEEILSTLQAMKSDDPDWAHGKIFGLVYYLGEEHRALLKDAYSLYMYENGLNMMAFKSLKKLENELVRTGIELMHGPKSACGAVTSGGTESILLAIKTYRDKANTCFGIKKPELVLPESSHVAFDKACEYFGVKMRKVRVDPKTFRADVDHARSLINRNTIAIVGAAPQYPQGVIDPIEDLAKLALEKNIGLHVDACVGGFLLPFMEMNGVKLPKWDFRVEGVTSISADIHKYGFAPKGASLLLWRDMDHMKHQFFIATEWPGGVYASPAIPGTKSGGSMAATWAMFQHFGIDGYKKLANTTYTTARKLIDEINAIDGLEIMGQPDASLFAYRSTDPKCAIYVVGDEMNRRGWMIDKQQKPEGLHAMIMPVHEQIVDKYLADLRESVTFARANPQLAQEGTAVMYGLISKSPIRGLVRDAVLQTMQQLYAPEGTQTTAVASAGPKLPPKWVMKLLDLWARIRAIFQ